MKTLLHSLIWAVVLTLLTGPAASAQTPARPKRPPNPAFAPIEDNPALPRVLLIGDSISIGYTLAVRKALEGVANVHRIPTNGGPTSNGIANLEKWLGDSRWDVIHFNWGLHDLKYMNPQTKALASPTAPGSVVQISLMEYEENLSKLVERLQKTGATLIWCSTTPVPEGSTGRVKDDELKYNEVAARVMKNAGVQIDDLYAFALPKLADIQLPKNVHFTPAGSAVLAQQVSAEIRKALMERAAAKK